MHEVTTPGFSFPSFEVKDVLTEIVREVAQTVLDELSKKLNPTAEDKLHEIWTAESRENAFRAFAQFLETYQAKYPKAIELPRRGGL